LATPRETGDGVVAETLRGSPEIALVGALLDLAHDALPILLVRVVALHRGFELEAQARVANLFASQGPEAAIDVFARRQRPRRSLLPLERAYLAPARARNFHHARQPSPTKALLSSPVGTRTTLSDFRRQIDPRSGRRRT
jgi:hypothetical protein